MDKNGFDTAAYLRRLGYLSPPNPTLQTLRELHLRHVQTFAFETISSLLHQPVPIDSASLQRKLLREGRGGYCFELNLAFLNLLGELGFDAQGLTGRVVMGGPEDAQTPRTHMLLLVKIAGTRWVVDAGFGGMTPSGPLQLDTEAAQATPHELYRITHAEGRYTLRAQVGGTWRALYVFDLAPTTAIDYEVANWYVATHPDSPFLGQLIAARLAPGARHVLHGCEYAMHRVGAVSERRRLERPDAIIELLRTVFAIDVPDQPLLRSALERLVAKAAVLSGRPERE